VYKQLHFIVFYMFII